MATSPSEIRYRPGDSEHNALLRLALLHVWSERCYWCKTKRQFGEVEIDHVIPRSLPRAEQERLVEQLLGADAVPDFDADALPNLAPICRNPCNGEKTAHIYDAPRYVETLQRVAAKAQDVEKFIRSYEASGRVGRALVAVMRTDLEDSRSLDALVEFAPLLESRLRAIEWRTTDEFEDPYSDVREITVVHLDQAGRQFRDMMALLTGEDPDEVLLIPISTVKQAVVNELASDIASQVHAAGLWYPEIAEPSTQINLVVTALRYNVDDAEFKMIGTFEADGSSQAAVSGADGDGLEFQQFDAYIPGTFQAWFGFNRGALEEGEVRITTEGPPFSRKLKNFRRD